MIPGIGAGKPEFEGSFVGLGEVRWGQICRVGGEAWDEEHADFGSAVEARREFQTRLPRAELGCRVTGTDRSDCPDGGPCFRLYSSP